MQIVDHNGQPIQSGSLAEPQTSNVGWLEREFEDHPARGLTPQRLGQIMVNAENRDLAGQLDLADDIAERDGHAYAELEKRSLAVAALDWDLQEPDGATAAEKSQTAQLRDLIKGIADFEDVLLEMMGAVLKGFSAHELLWEWDGKVLLPRLEFRPQRWFTLGPDRNELLLRSQSEQTSSADGATVVMGEQLRPFTWLVHRPRSRTGYAARSGLVRQLAWPYLFKNYATRDLAEFLEIFGLPLRVGSYPAGATPDERRTLLRAVTSIGHNAAGIIPQGMKIDFENAASGTDVPFKTMITLMEAVESRVILGQTLTASQGDKGSQALGNVHNEVRHDIRAADCRQVGGTLTTQLVARLGQLNIAGFNVRRTPRFALDDGEPDDITAYSTALPALAKAGLRIPKAWVHGRLRVPQAKEGDEVLTGGTSEADSSDDAGDDALTGNRQHEQEFKAKDPKESKEAALATSAAAPGSAPAPDLIDDLVADMTGAWRETMSPMIEPLLTALSNAVARGETAEQFAARMPELLDSMNYKPMAGKLARGTFVAKLAGEADLSINPGA